MARYERLICIEGMPERERRKLQPGQWVQPYLGGPKGRYMGHTGATDVVAYEPTGKRKVSLLRAYAAQYRL